MIKPFDKPITAARPALPSLEEFRRGLEGIWDGALLTNNGPLVEQFRDKPVEVDEEEFGLTRDQLYLKLREYNVLARPYFYLLVPDYACYPGLVASGNLPVARRAASRILTLPIYSDLALDDVDRICDIIEHIQSEAGRGTAAGNRLQLSDSEVPLPVAQS